MSRRAPFLALGTGRCGSSSLATILGNCYNTEITHEKWRGVKWNDINPPELDEMISHFNQKANEGVLIGDVQQTLFPHIRYLRSKIPDLKIICLHRDKESTVSSFMGFQPISLFHHKEKEILRHHGYPVMKKAVDWFPTFYEAQDREDSFKLWWELCNTMMSTIEEPVYHFDISYLNQDEKLQELMNWLDIPDEDRNIPETRKVLWFKPYSEQ